MSKPLIKKYEGYHICPYCGHKEEEYSAGSHSDWECVNPKCPDVIRLKKYWEKHPPRDMHPGEY